MKIHIIAAALPPRLDGIGDYTANLARELAKEASVKILTGQNSYTPLEGVTIQPAFSPARTQTIWDIIPYIKSENPDWVLLQYNPFSFGRWGFNPYLPFTMRAIQQQCPRTRLAIMVHETYFFPVVDLKSALMSAWQRWQLWMLGRTADVIFFSIQPWAKQFRSWFPNKPLFHIPVGSNIPMTSATREQARSELGISDDVRIIGLFGTAHPSRLWSWVREAINRAMEDGITIQSLYIGPHGPTVCEALKNVAVKDQGLLGPEDVSRRFRAMDVYLSPFADGVSTRRTSLMTGLQHGVATVGTKGPLTDELLQEHNGTALLLSSLESPGEFCNHTLSLLKDTLLRDRVGRAGGLLFQKEFTWERIASRFLDVFRFDASRNFGSLIGNPKV